MIKAFKNILIVTAVLLVGTQNVWAKNYTIDTTHSHIGFAIKHLQISTVRGSFNSFEGHINFDAEHPEAFSSKVSIEAGSIDTKHEARDNHLRNADFFDVSNHPTITFVSKSLQESAEGTVIVGDLTMKGITKTITIPVIISGPVTNPYGVEVIGIAGEAQFNRQDFGISWSKTLDSGGLVVDDNVKIIIELELKEQSS